MHQKFDYTSISTFDGDMNEFPLYRSIPFSLDPNRIALCLWWKQKKTDEINILDIIDVMWDVRNTSNPNK